VSETDKEPVVSMGGGRRWLAPVGVGLAGLAAFGLVTWMLGLGPFAYRQILYGSTEIYLLNMTPRPVFVTLDSGRPIEVGPEEAERTPLLGGTTTLTTRDEAGRLIEELEVRADGSPVLYNVEGAKCLVLSDVSSFYLGGQPADQGVKVVKTFERGSRVVVLPPGQVIWPRKTLDDKVRDAEKGVAWIDMVACPLLDPEEASVLEAHLNVLLTERKSQERALELQRKMLLEGSGAVDKAVGADKPPVRVVPDAGAADTADAGAADAASAL
jgi:hypothetical protein